jgi:hypothetical protein
MNLKQAEREARFAAILLARPKNDATEKQADLAHAVSALKIALDIAEKAKAETERDILNLEAELNAMWNDWLVERGNLR